MITRYLNIKIFLVWVGIVFSTATAWGQVSAEIHQANQLYSQNKFSEAAELYERVIINGVENGHLHYNLGNAYFRTGNLPQAILHYTKAQNLLPRNEDVEANLRYAIRQTVDKLEAPIPSSTILFWTRDFNLNEHWTGLLWANLFFWVSMAVWLQYQTPATRLARKILLAFLLLIMVSTGFRWYQENRHTTGVILPQQIDIHSGWNATTAVLFQLHQGTVVSISQEKENWYKIELSDARKGWTLKSNIKK